MKKTNDTNTKNNKGDKYFPSGNFVNIGGKGSIGTAMQVSGGHGRILISLRKGKLEEVDISPGEGKSNQVGSINSINVRGRGRIGNSIQIGSPVATEDVNEEPAYNKESQAVSPEQETESKPWTQSKKEPKEFEFKPYTNKKQDSEFDNYSLPIVKPTPSAPPMTSESEENKEEENKSADLVPGNYRNETETYLYRLQRSRTKIENLLKELGKLSEEEYNRFENVEVAGKTVSLCDPYNFEVCKTPVWLFNHIYDLTELLATGKCEESHPFTKSDIKPALNEYFKILEILEDIAKERKQEYGNIGTPSFY